MATERPVVPGVPDCADVKDGRYRDPESEVEREGGTATSRRRWVAEDETGERLGRNGPPPRDRGNRAV